MLSLVAFCINQPSLQGKPPSTSGSLAQTKALYEVSKWINNGVIQNLAYDSLFLDKKLYSETIFAVAYQWLFIALINNHHCSQCKEPEGEKLARQLKTLEILAKKQKLKGIAATPPNPNIQNIFKENGFESAIANNIPPMGIPAQYNKTF